jgi:hypothetical protein
VKSLVTAITVTALLAGCASDQTQVAKVHHRNHFSPLGMDAPDWPADAFDETKARAQFAAAKNAADKKDWAASRQAAEAGLALWPVEIEGWESLINACTEQNDEECARYATFFHAKLLTLNGLPMRVATLGFQTVADNEVGAKTDNFRYDQKTLDMATRLWAFCGQRDAIRDRNAEPTEASFDEAYPYVPMLIVIGVGAGILTGIKSVAK